MGILHGRSNPRGSQRRERPSSPRRLDELWGLRGSAGVGLPQSSQVRPRLRIPAAACSTPGACSTCSFAELLAQVLVPELENENFLLPPNGAAIWLDNELLLFPEGKYDDGVDMLEMMNRLLNDVSGSMGWAIVTGGSLDPRKRERDSHRWRNIQ